MEEAIMEFIRSRTKQLRDQNRHPDHVLYREVIAEVNMALNSLHNQGKIKGGPTMNDKYIKLID